MRTSFHHQPEAQHPNFQLSTSWQADYPIYRGKTGQHLLAVSFTGFDPERSLTVHCGIKA
jgi:hypothetical protein